MRSNEGILHIDDLEISRLIIFSS